jgi:hypothetical protein
MSATSKNKSGGGGLRAARVRGRLAPFSSYQLAASCAGLLFLRICCF